MTNPYRLIHSLPVLCFDVPVNDIFSKPIRSTTKIEDITCPKCQYFYTHPEARELELKYRAEKARDN